MTNYLRKNVWDSESGQPFKDSTGNYNQLYWYAKAVQVMQSRSISDPTSWWFYAAIHGEFLLNPITDPNYLYLNWKNITYIPQAAGLNAPPSSNLTDLFWDQCQHGTWFFPPWHRGYLVALEHILRGIIINQYKGPEDWALPYWNYLNQSTASAQSQIPPEFTVADLPDGTPNPLFVPERFGPDGNGNIYVQVGQDIQTDVTDECQWDTIYSETSPPPQPGPGDLFGYFYGGAETGFSHDGSEYGDLEMNPHNFVHGMVGGQSIANGNNGLMAVPPTAALDPVFYLHHSNIDRMWTAWNVTGKNNNATSADWLNGPYAQGERAFAMPLDSSGNPWCFGPGEVQQTTNIAYIGTVYSYTYDDLSLTSYDKTPPTPLHEVLTKRLINFGVTNLERGIKMANNKTSELAGASSAPLSLNSGVTQTTVKLHAPAWRSVEKSFLKASVSNFPDEVYVQLEGVKGGNDANFLSLYVHDEFVKTVSLFGLLSATIKEASHGNSGLNFKFNITKIVDELHLNSNFSIDSLDIQIKTKNPIPEGHEITIDRIGVYRLNK